MPKYYITINNFRICVSKKNLYSAVYAAHKVYKQKLDKGLYDIADMPFWMKANQQGFSLPNHSQCLIPYAIVMSKEWDGTGDECFCGPDVTEEMADEMLFLETGILPPEYSPDDD